MEEQRSFTVEDYDHLMDTYSAFDNPNTETVDCFYCSNAKQPGRAYKVPRIDWIYPIKFNWVCKDCMCGPQ